MIQWRTRLRWLYQVTISQPAVIVFFWAIVMGVVAGVLLLAGDGGLNALQSFIVITAVPVSFLIAFTFITGPIAVMRMQKEKEANLALASATAS